MKTEATVRYVRQGTKIIAEINGKAYDADGIAYLLRNNNSKQLRQVWKTLSMRQSTRQR